MTMPDKAPAPRPTRRPLSGGFGPLLRRWRQARGASQLDLALTCSTSQRHLSFLESGRARPSRGMVLQLAEALSVPLRHQNALLLAAGFAPAWDEGGLDQPSMEPVRAAIAHMLDRQAPYPAILVDRRYTLLQANAGATRLMDFLLGPAPPDAPAPNLLRLILNPALRPLLENFQEVAAWMIRRIRAEALLADPLDTDRELLAMLDHPAVTGLRPGDLESRPPAPALSLRFAKDGVRLSLFSVIAMLGTPLDAGLQDMRVELFYPADDSTAAWFQRPSP